MGHWLEEAEQEYSGKKKKRRSAEYLDRMHRIANNYQENKTRYDAFAKKMHELIARVNALPLEKKQPFGVIDAEFKESKLNSKKYVYKSSRRHKKKVFRGSLFDLIRPQNMKHVRILTMTVSSQKGKVGIDVRDEDLLKERIVIDTDVVKERPPYKDPGRYHQYHRVSMQDLNEKLALILIDWLAYKIELKDLPFIKK